jgi:hypothetical protein
MNSKEEMPLTAPNAPSHTSHIAQMPRNGRTGSQPVSSNLIASKHSADKGT